MEVKVNVVNEMRKLRETTYKDKATWVDELIQNAQRANASTLEIEVTEEKAVFEDDGVGCKEVSAIFEKSETGWGDEVKSQNPFGEGFFSTLMVADKIEVESIGFKATMDVKEILDKGNVDCIDVEESDREKGFKVTLTELNDDYNRWKVEERVKETAVYLNGMEVTFNNREIETQEITEPRVESEYVREIDTELMEGWVAPTDSIWEDLELYAQRRKVTDLYDRQVTGLIHAKENAVTLKAPDRKDYVVDDKWSEFKEQYKQEIKKMFLELVKHGGDEDLKKYEDGIDEYLDPDDYRPYIRIMSTLDTKMSEILQQFVEEADEKNQVSEKDNLEKVMENMDYEVEESESETIEMEDDKQIEISEEEKSKEKTGRKVEEITSDTFYVKREEMKEMEDKLSLAEYFDIPVVVIRNKLEENVIRDEIPHIRELEKRSRLNAKLEETGAKDEVEERAKFIFKAISKMLGLNGNIFEIGNLTVNRVQIVGDREEEEKVDNTLAVEYKGKIYIDRDELKTEGLEVSKSNRLTNKDRKFICDNIDTIGHELAHALHGTSDNTQEHEEAQRKIRNEIMEGLF